MHSSLFKHVWLIQPSLPQPPVVPVDAAGGASIRFSPAWDLLCLQSFLLERTGHTCSLIDTRCYESINTALDKLKKPPNPRATSVAIIYSTQFTIGSACAIAARIRNQHPEILNILCGPYVSSFPDTVGLLPNIDYGLAGDAEIVLRNLLEFLDIEHRLKLVPGLIIPGVSSKAAHWVQDLNSLSLPEWFLVDWRNYTNHNHKGARVEVRIARGHPGKKEDAAWPCPHEPLRYWPMLTLTQLFQKCSGHGISEVFFTDPPGMWTDKLLANWCHHLGTVRNSQAWAFQIMPRMLPKELLNELAANSCRRIEFIIPSCDVQLRSKYGMDVSDRELSAILAAVRDAKIQPQLKYWIQGPCENKDEASRVFHHIKAMDFPALSLYPFPLHHDSVLYQNEQTTTHAPPFSAWLEWAQKPDEVDAPPPLWHGSPGIQHCQRTIQSIHKRLRRNPWRHVHRVFRKIVQFRNRSNTKTRTTSGK